MENKQTIPIFFAVDNGYIPFLAVALQSLTEHASEKYYYLIKVLYTDISEENQEKIKKEIEELNNERQENLKTNKIGFKVYVYELDKEITVEELQDEYNIDIYKDDNVVVIEDKEGYSIIPGDIDD